MSSPNLNALCTEYLNKPYTKAFFAASKSYLGFCEQLVKTAPNPDVLKQFHPLLIELYYCGSKLEPVPGQYPKEWQEFHEPDMVYESLLKHLVQCFGNDYRFFYLSDPQSALHDTHCLWPDEHLADIYLSLNDSFKRIETLATPHEIHVGLTFLKRGFDTQWGPDCAVLLSNLHHPEFSFKLPPSNLPFLQN
ncbi:MAG: DUF5063 domain-containing protein [Bacteroidia bacterium]|jgi:hypothetical protein|nr:DUF5063 domain-containing protein [Bacteroidia bacterium]